jgi:hypothetical protein
LRRLVNFLAIAAIYCTAQFFAGLALFKAVAEFRLADRVSTNRLKLLVSLHFSGKTPLA